jgi:hypothetical protein
VLDCWRVESVEPDRRLRLFAEMKLPGRAWLEFEALPDDDGSRITQTATFARWECSALYWYALWPCTSWFFAACCEPAWRAESPAAPASNVPQRPSGTADRSPAHDQPLAGAWSEICGDRRSSVAVVGGGPAGSFFTYFLLQLAKRAGWRS